MNINGKDNRCKHSRPLSWSKLSKCPVVRYFCLMPELSEHNFYEGNHYKREIQLEIYRCYHSFRIIKFVNNRAPWSF